MNKLVGRAVLVGLGLLIGAGTAEVALRVTLDVYECVPELGWRFAAGSTRYKVSRAREFFQVVEFNDAGFRDRERSAEKPDGVYRALVLGDSIPAALQVAREQAFPALLEAELDGVEVVNAAIDGYGTGQELLLFRREASRYRPDLVLLFVFALNDVADNTRGAGSYNHYLSYRCGRPYFELRDGGIATLANAGAVRGASVLDRWLGGVRLYSSVYRTPRPVETPAFRNVDVFELGRSAPVREGLEVTLRLIEALDREVAAAGGRLAVVLVPDKREAGQLAQEHWTREQLRQPARRIGARLERAGIPYLDLFDPLNREVERGAAPYFRHDAHFNPAGHRMVTRALRRWLVRRCAELALPATACADST